MNFIYYMNIIHHSCNLKKKGDYHESVHSQNY